MGKRFKYAVLVVVTMLWMLVLRFALFLLNLPSDLALYGGILLMLSSVVVFPSIYKRIVRKKKVNEPTQPNPPTAA